MSKFKVGDEVIVCVDYPRTAFGEEFPLGKVFTIKAIKKAYYSSKDEFGYWKDPKDEFGCEEKDIRLATKLDKMLL